MDTDNVVERASTIGMVDRGGYEETPVGAAPEKLAYLFAPPGDIMFQGNFDALRRQEEEEEKYCLVNIQNHQEKSTAS